MSLQSLLSTKIVRAASIADAAFDAVVLVGSHDSAKQFASFQQVSAIAPAVTNFLKLHNGAFNSTSLLQIDQSIVPSGRLILAGTGNVSRDYDDVRRYQAAARKGIEL